VDDFALTSAERALLAALNRRGVRYLVMGLSAAVLQGAPVSTQDLDLWIERPGDETVKQAAADAGGFWIPAFGMQPPGIGGHGLERIDVVRTSSSLGYRLLSQASHRQSRMSGAAPRSTGIPPWPMHRPYASMPSLTRNFSSIASRCS